MKHESTRSVFAHWTERRGTRPAPERADIDPVAIRHALGDTLMLSADFIDELRFRLAGTRVCALFGRELKGESFNELWNEDSRGAVEDLVAIVTTERSGAVAGVTARTESGDTLDLELLLLPLAYTGHARIRALGVLVPHAVPFWLGEKPVAELALGVVRHVGDETDAILEPRVLHAPQEGRVRHGFVVYSGGRETSSGNRTG